MSSSKLAASLIIGVLISFGIQGCGSSDPDPYSNAVEKGQEDIQKAKDVQKIIDQHSDQVHQQEAQMEGSDQKQP